MNYLSVYLVLKYTVKLPLIWASNSEQLTLFSIFLYFVDRASCNDSW